MSTEPPSLAARLEQTGPLHWREAARLTARIARTLDRLHAQGAAHGGIEPLTVLFVGGTVRLADPLPPETRHASFIAPTVSAGEPANRQCDFFALGRTMAVMVTADRQVSLDLSPARLPPPLLAVQRRLVTADAAAGYGSGNDIAAALELAIAASEGFATVTPESPSPPNPPCGMDEPPQTPAQDFSPAPLASPVAPPTAPVLRRRRRRPRAVGALLALLALGGLAVLWLRPVGEVALERQAVTSESLPPAPAPAGLQADLEPDADAPSSEAVVADELPLEQVLAALPDLPSAAPAAEPSTMEAIDSLLSELKERPCTRLEVEPTTVGLRLVGSTTSPTGRTEILAAIGTLEDIDNVRFRLDEAGSFCRLYDMLAAHAESAMPRLADLFPSRADYRLAASEPLVLRVLTPDFPSHLTVDYFTADGMVVHLEMRQAEAPPLPPVEAVWIGDPADGQWLTIAEPFGEELIAVIASREPLFAEPRPRIESAETYLDALEAAFAAQVNKPEASTIAIRTIPAGP